MEVWKILAPESRKYPDRIRFSIVAFKESLPSDAIVMDCHPPKGPHYHLDGNEIAFEWDGLDKAEEKFWQIVEEKFGKIKESLK